MHYATLWNSLEVVWEKENKIYWVLYDRILYQVVQSEPWFSPTLYEQQKMVVDFKATFHNIHIHTKGIVEGVWYKFPYLVIEEDLIWVTTDWPPSWLTPPNQPCTPTGKSMKKATKKLVDIIPPIVTDKAGDKEPTQVTTKETTETAAIIEKNGLVPK